MINILTSLALPVLMAAPAHRQPAVQPADSAAMTLVVVENNRNVPVTVYEEDDFGDVKLAVVGPNATETVRLDHYLSAPSAVRFFIQPRGQLEEGTGLLDIDPGEHVAVVVPTRAKGL